LFPTNPRDLQVSVILGSLAANPSKQYGYAMSAHCRTIYD
jgi:hypothetical protein